MLLAVTDRGLSTQTVCKMIVKSQAVAEPVEERRSVGAAAPRRRPTRGTSHRRTWNKNLRSLVRKVAKPAIGWYLCKPYLMSEQSTRQIGEGGKVLQQSWSMTLAAERAAFRFSSSINANPKRECEETRHKRGDLLILNHGHRNKATL